MMDSSEIFLCHHCGKIFYKLSTLESHTKWKHMERSDDFMCEQCGKTFHKKFNLLKHLASGVHQISESVKCALCDFRSLTRKVMCGHYQNFHRIILNENNAYFNSVEEFFSWKVEYENTTRSRFVKMSSSRQRKNGLLRSTYYCHRDGNFISKGKNLRHLKMKGSNKINAHCPAKIDVEMGENIIIVSYIDTHLGHDLDISRMKLDPEERAVIAEKLALKVPFEQILDEINNKKIDNDIERLNLLTRKDLWNIVETYKINPKTVVYSKTRTRRKKRLDQSKITLNKNQVLLKAYEDNCSKKQNENKFPSTKVKEEECTNQEMISLKENNGDNFFLCPIILKDENNEDMQQYVVLSDDQTSNEEGYFIINANGELESISGNDVIYSEDNGVQISDYDHQMCENDAMQICEDSVVQSCVDSEIQICDKDTTKICSSNDIAILNNGDIKVYNNEEVQILENSRTQMNERNGLEICKDETIEMDEGQSYLFNTVPLSEIIQNNKTNLDIKPIKTEYSATNKNKLKSKSNEIVKMSNVHLKKKDNIKKNSGYTNVTLTVFKEECEVNYDDEDHKSNNEADSHNIYEQQIKTEPEEVPETHFANCDNDSSMINFEEVLVDHMPENEVTIDSFGTEQETEYIIIPEENVPYCNLVTNIKDVHEDTNTVVSHVSQDGLLTEEEVKMSNDTVLKGVVPHSIGTDGDGLVDECVVDEEGGYQWNKKREEVLHKLLNVHSLINNEKQLQVFSNNITSLENVLKSLSKNDVTNEIHSRKSGHS